MIKNTIDAIVLVYSDNVRHEKHEVRQLSNTADSCWHQDFLYGIEEESVPIKCINSKDIDDIKEPDALAMAKVASKCSVFEIGVGVDCESIIVRHRLQGEDDYLFKISRDASDEEVRIQGHNTARIIKKLPLFLD